MPNRLSQFWQELKRRKVIRVITVYAASAFVILELVDIITEPFGLPEWTMILVVVLLTVGFIITVIVSWIYDIHPEGGIVKTEPAHKIKEEDKAVSSKSWKIASHISFVVIVALIVLNIIPRTGNKEIIDKSIAVLPFRNESSDDENTYFINGMMESILDNFSRVEDLRVISRNSVEKYRDDPKPTPVVAEEMDVGYVLEGSGQKVGNRLLLTLQLIVGKEDRHIWSRQYDREIDKVEDLIDIQKEVAQLVVKEIEAIITPEEKKLIEKVPTNSLTAYDFYQRGSEEYWEYWWFDRDTVILQRAEDLYFRALYYDSTYAEAYAGLANVYWAKYFNSEYLSESFLDSAMSLLDIAISYDDQCGEAYRIRGACFRETGNIERAIEDYEKALKYNPNDWMVYVNTGGMYSLVDIVKSIESWQKATLINRGSELPLLLRRISSTYINAGFFERGNYYRNEALRLDGDSLAYYMSLAEMELNRGNYVYAGNLYEKTLISGSTSVDVLFRLGYTFSFLDQHGKSLKYFEQWLDQRTEIDNQFPDYLFRIGYAYYKNGYSNEAESYFNKQIEYSSTLLILGRSFESEVNAYFNLAGTYGFLGDREEALENFRKFNQSDITVLWMVTQIKNDPFFDSIRDEPEFQQIVREVEAKYQAEHERVRQWLEENEML